MTTGKNDPYYDVMCDDHFHSVKVENNSVLCFKTGVRNQLQPSRLKQYSIQADKLLKWCRQSKIAVHPVVLIMDKDESLENWTNEALAKAGFVRTEDLDLLKDMVSHLCERLAFTTQGEKTPEEIRSAALRLVLAARMEAQKGGQSR